MTKYLVSYCVKICKDTGVVEKIFSRCFMVTDRLLSEKLICDWEAELQAPHCVPEVWWCSVDIMNVVKMDTVL